MSFSTELVITPVKAVVCLKVAQPVDHVEHCEAQREESSGNLVNSEKYIQVKNNDNDSESYFLKSETQEEKKEEYKCEKLKKKLL